jgi:tRNA nucleotidyltransferase (CCA-adding enzyme)
MKIEMPSEVKFIISELESHEYEAFAVGGCIRDSLLGRTPNDWDITTSAKPEEVKEIFHSGYGNKARNGYGAYRQKVF